MPRRGEYIYKRKDGRWEGRTLKLDGKYRYFYSRTYKGVKEKMKNFQEIQESVKEKLAIDGNDVCSLFEAWLEDASLRVKPSTYESYYRCMDKYVIPFFKQEKNLQITEDSVFCFVKAIRENNGLADSSKKKYLTIFKIALKEILKGAPEGFSIIEQVKVPRPEDKEVMVFSMKAQRIIENAALNSKDRRATGIILSFYTGIRLGELCSLKWGDIEMETGTLFIARTVSRIKHFEEGESKTSLQVGAPKSRKSLRKMPLPDFLLKMAEERGFSNAKPDHYIFSDGDTPLDPRSFQKLYKKLLRDAHVQDRKFHAIRHTFATRALELGVDVKTISELLGHSSVSITLNVYSHSLMEQKKAAIEKFNRMYLLNMETAAAALPDPGPALKSLT
ncbi:MAG TPA: site-specific integrase [Lachnoclostridium sp.]|nr:site-specific integrase [Lachnoclostridium sp.]